MTKSYYYRTFLLLILSIFATSKSYSHPTVTKSGKSMVVIIDPGHGGKDPGAISKGIREKDAVLGIGLKLGNLINENFPDVKVIFTRSTDVFVPLIERSRIANKNKANLFISLHANFCGTPSIRGTETYCLGLARSNENLDVAKKENSVILLEDNYNKTYEGFDPNSPESYIMFETVQDIYMEQSLSFADDIQQQFDSSLKSSNRGVKQAGFLVLRESSMPSVLVETGFISNPTEAKYLMSENGQMNIANSILEAFRKFKSKSSSPQSLASTHDTSKKDETKSLNNDSTQKKEKDQPLKDTLPAEKPAIKEESPKAIPEKVTEQPKKLQPKAETPKPAEAKTKNINTDKNTYFSVQIAASTTSIDPADYNFKGVKNVRREKSDKYYRYFVGKEATTEQIIPLWTNIKQKFPQAFIVSFTAGERTIVNIDGK